MALADHAVQGIIEATPEITGDVQGVYHNAWGTIRDRTWVCCILGINLTFNCPLWSSRYGIASVTELVSDFFLTLLSKLTKLWGTQKL